jgi:CDP-diacylglycerol--serine O-phosphatidyltransferase
MPSPAAAAVPAATVFAYPYGLQDWLATLALPMVLVPAFLMISTVRYRSFKTFDLRSPRSARKMIVLAVVMAAIAADPQWSLVALAYTYLLSGFVEMAVWRLRRPAATSPDAGAPPSEPADPPPALAALPPAERNTQEPGAL